MKQHGMTFTGPSIPALLSGAKTQARRLMREQPFCPGGKFEPIVDGKWLWIPKCENDEDSHNIKAPPHSPGDLIWVREEWRAERKYDHLRPAILAKPLRPVIPIRYEADRYTTLDDWGRYRNARFLPRRFARIWLRVLDVRQERLEDISEADAIAEGATLSPCTHPDCQGAMTRCAADSYRGAFVGVWNRLHEAHPWGSKPWVWRIEFERKERPA